MKHALLALLAKEPAHGYELKQAIDAEFGAIWGELNSGQVYVVLGRLESAGLVTSVPTEGRGGPSRRVYELTPVGRDELVRWVDETVDGAPVRSEFFVKLVLAEAARVADPITLVDRQRRAHLRRLREVQRLGAEVPAGSTAALLVEGAALHLQADLRWLELCERHYTRGGAR
ncbi:MAG TPA: PadR family transcriptional regulator [Mycobacteriales bacterium]|nr:PadR family transcriptional regulator [Mycobacteriales bacterium]